MNTWRDLDRATRKALLRGEPAADPETDRIARAYAEKALQRFPVQTAAIVLPAIPILGFLLGFGTGKMGLKSTDSLPVIIIGAIGLVVVAARRKLALTKILNVSQGAPREQIAPGSSEPLEIRVRLRGLLLILAPYVCISILLLVTGWLVSNPWVTGIAVVVAVPVFWYCGWLLYSALSGGAVVLDADGVHTSKHKVRVGWESVREIRVIPLRATASDPRQVLAFVLHDDDIYLRQLSSWQASLARTNSRTYQSPMVSIEGLVDKPIDEIAATAAALSGLPVSRTPRGATR
ncbi:hypothetical protein [Nocardia altamirensis]|uniref:hypothetical protein n=1 Tax=Nocardia altamirensis TaxID=472158 RepID=UPI0008405250|nr:hypothetical protein [Nocardia altamirensis]